LIAVQGRFWLKKEERNFLGRGRVELLRKIDELGSISQAARAMKMSYKSAWDAVDAMNRTADAPLVEKVLGGKGGGSARLTEEARQLMALFERMEGEHQAFLVRMTELARG